MLKDDMLLALDPVRFSQSIGIDPDPWQADVLRHEGKRVLLNCCRQSGKSTTTATKALHQALFFPKSLVLCGAPSLRQSQELFRKIRSGINAMKEPPKLLEDNQLSLTIGNYSRIIALPGDPATVRGYSGVNLILLDEAAQIADDFYSAILPMLLINKGQLIAMSTPFGKRGFFFDEWTTGGPEWMRIEVDATQCPRFTAQQLEQQRRSMGDLAYQQEFCCKFVDNATQTFSGDAIMRAFVEDVEPLDL